MSTNTSNYGLIKPAVNDPTDADLWGGYLNTDMDDIDGLFSTAIKWPKSNQTSDFSVTAPTPGSTTTGDSKKFFLCDATAGAIVVTLPAASSAGDGFTVAFKKTDSSANTVTLTPNGSEKIDGASTLVLSAQYTDAVIISDGSNWNIQGAISSLAAYAPLDSPAFTGTPTAPTASANDSSTKLATTAFTNPGATFSSTTMSVELPSGIIMKAGRSSGTATITFPVAFPTACIVVVGANTSSPSATAPFSASSISASSFVGGVAGSGDGWNWLAYGY